MRKPGRLLALLFLLAIVSVGVVQEQEEQEEQEIGTATVNMTGTNDLGEFIADGEEMTLYAFTQDRGGSSFCYHRCAEDYPPFLTSGEPQAGEGIDQSLLGTHERADGTMQVTYNNRPLYRYHEDEVPNDTYGQHRQAYRGEWFVVSPEGDLKGAEKEADGAEGGEGDADGNGKSEVLASGEQVFASRCQVCHGNTAPEFEGNENLADAEYVIFTILNGKAGGAMPAWRDTLDDEQIASVASFIRMKGPNEFGMISPDEVSSIRGH